MNPDNYTKVQRLMSALRVAQNAKAELDKILSCNLCDSDGHDAQEPGVKNIYTFYLTEHRDHSGLRVDLTGLGISVSILEGTLLLVESRIEELNKEIKEL